MGTIGTLALAMKLKTQLFIHYSKLGNEVKKY